MSTIPTFAVILVYVVGMIAIVFIPDRHKPWWEKKRDRN